MLNFHDKLYDVTFIFAGHDGAMIDAINFYISLKVFEIQSSVTNIKLTCFMSNYKEKNNVEMNFTN